MDHASSACRHRLPKCKKKRGCVSDPTRAYPPSRGRGSVLVADALDHGRRGLVRPLGKLADDGRQGHGRCPEGPGLVAFRRRRVQIQDHRHADLCTLVKRCQTQVSVAHPDVAMITMMTDLCKDGAVGRADRGKARGEGTQELAGAVVVVVRRQAERQVDQIADHLRPVSKKQRARWTCESTQQDQPVSEPAPRSSKVFFEHCFGEPYRGANDALEGELAQSLDGRRAHVWARVVQERAQEADDGGLVVDARLVRLQRGKRRTISAPTTPGSWWWGTRTRRTYLDVDRHEWPQAVRHHEIDDNLEAREPHHAAR